MNSLREIGIFVGLSSTISMRAVGNIVPLLSSSERTSMKAMIRGLQNLPSISLKVEVVGDRNGEAPFAPIFRVHPSSGVILETRITLAGDGQQPGGSVKVVDSGDFSPFMLNVPDKIFKISVTRTGITNKGITRLEKDFHVEATSKPKSQPPSRNATCTAEFHSFAGSGIVQMRIFGGGFSPKETVEIVENGQQVTTTQADDFGLYAVIVGFFSNSAFPVNHSVHAHGLTSGLTSSPAGFTV